MTRALTFILMITDYVEFDGVAAKTSMYMFYKVWCLNKRLMIMLRNTLGYHNNTNFLHDSNYLRMHKDVT